MEKIELLKSQSNSLFNSRNNLVALWQELAENFYPERATFTAQREPGAEFASNLETSYPILARRDLGNQIGGMLRPTNKDWFKIVKRYEVNLDDAGKKWLEWASKIQKRAMYDPVAMFTRATKEGDHDWATFGQSVFSVRMNLRENALLYRTWHLRDVVWQEDYIGRVGAVYRKWKPSAIMLFHIFKDKIHPKVRECVKTEPYKEFEILHCEVPSDTYGDEGEWKDKPLVSIYYDVLNNHIMEEIGVYEGEYIIPRWQTISGSQYAFSPAAIVALPDARLIQSIAGVLLDASERAIDPPMIAVKEAIRSDISVYAGGITWVAGEYDERLGEVLREIKQGGQIPIGFEMNADTRQMISEAFYLNKLALPPPVSGMTAYEASERVAEYIRQALPLFEPMESEYNAALCEKTFNLLMSYGAFGSAQDIPESLYGGDITFQFESPMRDAVEKQKGQKFVETSEMIVRAIELDPSAAYVVDPVEALRDALDGIGSPAKWRRSEIEVQEMELQAQETQQAQLAMDQAQQAAGVIKEVA